MYIERAVKSPSVNAAVVDRGVSAPLIRLLLVAGAALTVFLAATKPASADGFIIPVPPPHVESVPDVAVRYHHVQVSIEDQVAETEIDQVFLNDSPYELEGTYVFPLPEDAAISDFAMFVDGKRLSGKILDKDEARRLYESIVRRRQDPALLEYVGRNAFQASIYPFPAHGEKRVQLSYSQVLRAENGLVRYVYPLNTERFSSRPLEEVLVTINIRSQVPIKAVYSPSHEVAVERPGETWARVSFEANNVRPDKDLELYYSVSEEDVSLTLLSHRERGEDGFFLLFVAPKIEAAEEAVVAKDVVFVLDTSGSMDGQKLQQAKDAVEFVLDRLNATDRFNVIGFSTTVSLYASNLRPASERRDAHYFVRDLTAGGGTNIDRALEEALTLPGDDRPRFIIFLTDGLPTVGETDLEHIIRHVDEAAGEHVRLFTFGVGYDVNTLLLDTISQAHRGASAYVEPEQDIEEEVAAFYAKIRAPLLSDLRLEVRGVTVEDMYPDPLPDLFAGGQLLVVGRYREGGTARLTLRGRVNDEERAFSYGNLKFADAYGQDFVPRLWATRKIGYMLNQIRLHGENKELVDSIVSLSVRYGIMTPYTSFLVDEREEVFTDAGRSAIAERSSLGSPSAMPSLGAKAVADSQVQSSLASAEHGGGEETPQIRLVANKTFILREGAWMDTAFDPQKMQAKRLAFGSSGYFHLLTENAQWGKYLALGERVIVVLDGQAYQIEPRSVEEQTTPTPQKATQSPAERLLEWLRPILRW